MSGRLPERERERARKKREIIDERKMSKQPPPAPAASAVGPCPTKISKTPRHRKFIQHHRTIRPPQTERERERERERDDDDDDDMIINKCCFLFEITLRSVCLRVGEVGMGE